MCATGLSIATGSLLILSITSCKTTGCVCTAILQANYQDDLQGLGDAHPHARTHTHSLWYVQLLKTKLARLTQVKVSKASEKMMRNDVNQADIKKVDMPDEMRDFALKAATEALDRHKEDWEVGAYVRERFDEKFKPAWHCIVGRSFGGGRRSRQESTCNETKIVGSVEEREPDVKVNHFADGIYSGSGISYTETMQTVLSKSWLATVFKKTLVPQSTTAHVAD
ncbi:hypothetical protein T265_10622 [Opisthorchis viverrini]|uniref:Dynein light chain n=1 Tax=Opisthorchis viverrini TaxID=6198 RepID=A0A074ZCK8_OPIVI|nr:hypothetical protein T265_10622 [Opisthorchis viverrini]KER20935.1 hypothetical protein T265_10622 [Opisthorchis viverrini]